MSNDSLDGELDAFAQKQQPPLEERLRAALKKRPLSEGEIVEALDTKPSEVRACIEAMHAAGLNIGKRADGRYTFDADVLPGGQAEHASEDRGDGWSVIGFTSDNHLGSKHERLDVLNALYDTFAAEGVKHVYNGGNWIEGDMRLNKHDVKVFGLDDQVDHFIQNYPQRPGLTTHYVAGDDHEGWYQQRERINIGRHLENAARAAGRTDLHYLGYVEADIALRVKGGASVPMKVMHGGGGSSYAYSYVLQKTVEAFQGGEKPAVLAVGHYHKFDYCFPRSVHAFMMGCTEDQSIFMRKRKIEAHVGGVLVRLKQDAGDGHITQFEVRWMPFYDLGYYERRFE